MTASLDAIDSHISMRPGEKKEGGGGNFTWGKADGSQDLIVPTVHVKDPNYDPNDEVTEFKEVTFSPPRRKGPAYADSILTPEHWLYDVTDMRQLTRTKIEEALTAGIPSAFVQWMKSLQRPKLHSFVLQRLISIAADKTEAEQQVAWSLIEVLYTAKVVTHKELRRAFDRLYVDENLAIDTPVGPEVVLYFLESCISAGMLRPTTVLRVPVDFLHLGRGAVLLRGVTLGELVLVDKLETIGETKEKIKTILQEFYATGAISDVCDFCVLPANRMFASILIRKAIELSMERKSSDKELCCELLSTLRVCVSDIDDFVEAFDDLLWHTREWQTDVPGADAIMAKFLARAVVDEYLPANYLQESELMAVQPHSPELDVLKEAQNVLRRTDVAYYVMSMWGPKVDGLQTYNDQYKVILQEYLDSGESQNAVECLKDLHSRYYLHQFVKKALEAAIELQSQGKSEETNKVIALLRYMSSTGVLTEELMRIGQERIRRVVPDLELDLPRAGAILDSLLSQLS